MIRNNASELKRMYIEPKYRRQKIGKFLLEYAIEKSVHFGATEMYLESPPPFKPAHKLYLKNGFELIEEYPEVSIPNELRFNSSSQQIHLNTSDGSDSGYLNLSGGGDCAQT